MAQSERDRNEWGGAEMEGGSRSGGEPEGGRMSSADEEIRRRAYELFESRGGEPGGEVEDWLAAERELRTRMERGGTAAVDPASGTGMGRRGGARTGGASGDGASGDGATSADASGDARHALDGMESASSESARDESGARTPPGTARPARRRGGRAGS